MFSLHVVDHPLVADKVRGLRDESTSNAEFQRLLGDVARYLAYEAFRDAPTIATTVHTPLARDTPAVLLDHEYVIVPIVRAGLGMSPAVQSVLPRHRVCLVGLRRNAATLQPEVYMNGLPDEMKGVKVVVCDPMLATGGSLVRVLDMLRERGATEVTVLCLIASAPGVAFVRHHHTEVQIVCAALDAGLNDVGFIVPGLGDAGDRLFGPPTS